MIVVLAVTALAADPALVGPVAPTAAAVSEWPALYPGQVQPGDSHFDLELVYYEGRFEEGLKLVDQRIAKTPNDPDLYWMKVRFMYEVGERFPAGDKSIDRIDYYERMIAAADKGLALSPGHVHLRFGRGIAMGRLGTTRGVLSSLFMAKDVERDWLAAASGSLVYSSLGGREMLPCDAFHALGIYYRLVPDWWIVQAIAGTRGSLDKSLAYSLKAVQCKADDIDNWKELGATQLCIGEQREDAAMTANGLQSLNKALALAPVLDRGRIDQRHSQMLINDPSLACEYSRDGQQDLDEAKLKAE
jgi:hypothetical protein